MAEEALLKSKDLCEILSCHRATLWRFCKSGQLPMPLKVGGQNRWKASDIHDYIQEKIAQTPPRKARKRNKREQAILAHEPKHHTADPKPPEVDSDSDHGIEVAATHESETVDGDVVDLRLAGKVKRRHRPATPQITTDHYPSGLTEQDRERLVEGGGASIRWRL